MYLSDLPLWLLFCEVLGVTTYIAQKGLLSFYERNKNEKLKYLSWIMLLFGVPAWVVILIYQQNYIFAGVEGSVFPIVIVKIFEKKIEQAEGLKTWLDRLCNLIILIGIALSVWAFVYGINTVLMTRLLEVVTSVSFVVGTKYLSQEKLSGYAWYILMHLSCGVLFAYQGYYTFLVMQIISIGFIIDAWVMKKRRRNE
jgi:hypothetical protein